MNSGICACLDVSSLPFMRLLLFGCLQASANQCSAGAGLVHGKFKKQPYFGYKLPSVRHVFQHCVNPVLKNHPHYLKKNLALYHFLLANPKRQTLKYDLKPPNKWGWQPLESSCHSSRSPPGDALCSLSCHSGFADASAPVRHKTGITTF